MKRLTIVRVDGERLVLADPSPRDIREAMEAHGKPRARLWFGQVGSKVEIRGADIRAVEVDE